MATPHLLPLFTSRPPALVGSKAYNLQRLARKKYPVPAGWVCTTTAYNHFLAQPEALQQQLLQALEQRLEPGAAYAVRSSATVEDGLENSFAGQFASILNLQGPADILAAIRSIWESAGSAAVQSYRVKRASTAQPLQMAVIVQQMVHPTLAGVAFSRNPVNGLNETVIEAVEGSGEKLVQSGVTPARWVFRRAVCTSQPADSIAPDGLIAEIAAQTQAIAQTFKQDVDLEWAYDGRQLHWLQMRPITALDDIPLYSNRIAKEMSPGLIKPLVWSLTIPLHARVWRRLLTELVGPNTINVDRMVRPFYYRAYYNMSVFRHVFGLLGLPGDFLEMMMGLLPQDAPRRFRPGFAALRRLPYFLRFLFSKRYYRRQAEADYPPLFAAAQGLAARSPGDMQPAAILDHIAQTIELAERVAYHTTVSILHMQIFAAFLRLNLRRMKVDDQQFDLTEDWAALKEFDPNAALGELHRRYQTLTPAEQEMALDAGLEAPASPQLAEFRAAFAGFLEQFGHLSDRTVDFTSLPWRETPDLLLTVIAGFSPPAPTARRIRYADLPRRGLWLRLVYRQARAFRLLREMYSSLFTRTLMTVRTTAHSYGQTLVSAGLLDDWQDIFLLYESELRAHAAGQDSGAGFAALAAARRAEMDSARCLTVPEVIYGDVAPPILTASERCLAGVAAARGYYTGRVKVVRGLADFPKLNPGDVLVIPHSDVSWTPLFVHAGAVIAESGGVLSHSAIIAREYAIPAVVSVCGALELPDDALVCVDGYKGEVQLASTGP